jgi:hypothetical protein
MDYLAVNYFNTETKNSLFSQREMAKSLQQLREETMPAPSLFKKIHIFIF